MGVDVEKFTRHLRDNAVPGFGRGRCGEYVRKALQAGGAQIPQPYPTSGKLFGPTLLMLGFRSVAVDQPEKFTFRKGDVMVMQSHTGGNPNGHVAGFDGINWISDFVQRDFWAGPGYRKHRPGYVVYRL